MLIQPAPKWSSEKGRTVFALKDFELFISAISRWYLPTFFRRSSLSEDNEDKDALQYPAKRMIIVL